jgi:uncharacterized membrane protein HdeD (DUF308 family)
MRKRSASGVGSPDPEGGAIGHHWIPFFLEGAVLVALGLLAVVIPSIASSTATNAFGWLFFVSGAVGLATTHWTRHVPGYWWSLVSALLGLLVGALLILQQTSDLYRGLYIGWPIERIAPLTLVLVVFFAIEGMASIMYALSHRSVYSKRWAWMLASGIIDLILAIVVVLGIAGTAAWAVGLLVGVNMVFGGIALIGMALHARAEGTGVEGS